MGFSDIKNFRIQSLTDGAVVQLRFGKAAVKNGKKDTIVEAKKLKDFKEGDKSLMVFEEHRADGSAAEPITISKFPGAAWRAGSLYVSLVGVDESTMVIQKAATPIQTDVITEAIKWIHQEYDDVFAPEQLIALLSHIQTGKRINTEVKALATQLAHKLVHDLSQLEPKEQAQVEG